MVTEQQLVEFIAANNGCLSKDIAKHFGVSKHIVNRGSPEFPSVYKCPFILHDNYKHYVTIVPPTQDSEPTEGNIVELPPSYEECITPLRLSLPASSSRPSSPPSSSSPKLKLKITKPKLKLKITKPKTETQLYDGHTVEEWESYGYDVTMYEIDDFPLEWNKAIKYGRCTECGCTDDLREAHRSHTSYGTVEITGCCFNC